MSIESFNEAYSEIHEFRDKLGETFYDAIEEYDNTCYEMAKCIVAVFGKCENEHDFEIADNMLTAVCGYSVENLINRIRKRDSEGYPWEY